MTLRQILVIVAIVLFIAAGAGVGPFDFGTVKLQVLPFGLAFFAASFLVP